ncbi:hypothetical protein K466DRAFT_65355 [Polyporus arcularius HHB13444]|uniref:Secreted protein n=1 Tax=Polyporus arcularius HHB13444 TaxID=1314778 RepID=A0A5C3PIC2_9APHY|nr:hypothetical protein K466DRAFT_65355 [Polyporus arcularius HHB13444]
MTLNVRLLVLVLLLGHLPLYSRAFLTVLTLPQQTRSCSQVPHSRITTQSGAAQIAATSTVSKSIHRVSENLRIQSAHLPTDLERVRPQMARTSSQDPSSCLGADRVAVSSPRCSAPASFAKALARLAAAVTSMRR